MRQAEQPRAAHVPAASRARYSLALSAGRQLPGHASKSTLSAIRQHFPVDMVDHQIPSPVVPTPLSSRSNPMSATLL